MYLTYQTIFLTLCVPQLIQLLSYRRQRTLYFKGHLGLENWFITDLCSWRFWLNFRQSLQLPHAWNNSFQMLLDIWCYGLESVAYLKYKEILLCIPLLGWFTRISNFLMIAYSMLGRDHLELHLPITSCKSKLSKVHFGISSRSRLGSLFMLSLRLKEKDGGGLVSGQLLLRRSEFESCSLKDVNKFKQRPGLVPLFRSTLISTQLVRLYINIPC